MSSNIDDLEPLTPSHLLYGRKTTSMPYYEHYTDGDITTVQSDQTTITNQAVPETLMTRIREFHRTTGSRDERIRVGDVVQIHEEGPRNRWNLAVLKS